MPLFSLSFHLQVETLEDEIKRLADLEAASKQTKFVVEGDSGPVYCNNCTTELATHLCEICTTNFCKPCCDLKHARPPWSAHAISELATLNFSGGTGIPDAPPKRRRRASPNRRSRSRSPGEGGESRPGTGDSDGRRRRRRRRKKKPDITADDLAGVFADAMGMPVPGRGDAGGADVRAQSPAVPAAVPAAVPRAGAAPAAV